MVGERKSKLNNLTYMLVAISMYVLLLFAQFSFLATQKGILLALKILFCVVFLLFLKVNNAHKREFLIPLGFSFVVAIYSLIPAIFMRVNYPENVSFLNNIVSICDSAMRTYYLFAMFFMSYRFKKQKDKLKPVFYIILVSVVLMICYSLIFERENIINSFTQASAHSYQISALFANKNTLGLFVFMGMVLSTYFAQKKPIFYLLDLVMLVYLFICHSKAPLLLGTILLLVTYISFLVKKDDKGHVNYTKILINLGVLLLLFVVALVICLTNTNFANTLTRFISQTIFDDGVITIKDRLKTFGDFFSNYGAFGLIFGKGLLTSAYAVNIAVNRAIIDNIYIFHIQTGGFINLLIMCALYIALTKQLKYEKNEKVFFVTALVLYPIYGLFESISLFNITCFCLPIYLLILSMVKEDDPQDVKHVLHLGSSLNYGGIEKVIFELYKGIDKNKMQFDLINSFNSPIPYEKEYKQNGATIYYLDIKRKGRYFKYLCSVGKFFFNTKIDAIVYHFGDLTSASITLLAYLCGIRNINYDAHMSEGAKESLIRRIVIFINRSLVWLLNDNCFADSIKSRDYTFLGNKDKVTCIIPLSINKYLYDKDFRISIRKKYGVSDDTSLIGNVGRIEQGKNQLRTLEIFKLLKTQNNDKKLKLMFVGATSDNEYKALIDAKIKEYELEDDVIFTGMINENVEKYYSAFDLFLFTSKHESFGLVLIEAQISGLPVVSSYEVKSSDVVISKDIDFVTLKEPNEKWSQSCNDLISKGRNNVVNVDISRFDDTKCAQLMCDKIFK